MVSSIPAFASANTNGILFVVNVTLAFRSGPGTNYTNYGYFTPGDIFNVSGQTHADNNVNDYWLYGYLYPGSDLYDLYGGNMIGYSHNDSGNFSVYHA